MPRQGDNNDPASDVVRTRLILNFPGFIDIDTRTFFDRLEHSTRKTSKIFALALDTSARSDDDTNVDPAVDYKSTGDGWSVDARFVQFDWQDIVEHAGSGLFPVTLVRNALAYLTIFTDGTIWRYLKTSKLYFGFAVYPLLLMIAFAAVAVFVARQLGTWLGATGAGYALVVILLSAAIWLLLCRWPGNYFYLPLSLSNWGFSRKLVVQDASITRRIDQFSSDIAREVTARDYDEILFCCHSFGSLWAICSLSKALQKQPDLLAGKKVTFLALGSSHLKVALCSRGKWVTPCLQQVVDDPNLFWHEFQSKDDVVAFYKADPFKPIGVKVDKKRYAVDRVRFKNGLKPQRYKSIKRSFYRVHTQYTLYWDKPVSWDIYLRLFGPYSSLELAEKPNLHKQLQVRNQEVSK